jgi:hypothetical protein
MVLKSYDMTHLWPLSRGIRTTASPRVIHAIIWLHWHDVVRYVTHIIWSVRSLARLATRNRMFVVFLGIHKGC